MPKSKKKKVEVRSHEWLQRSIKRELNDFEDKNPHFVDEDDPTVKLVTKLREILDKNENPPMKRPPPPPASRTSQRIDALRKRKGWHNNSDDIITISDTSEDMSLDQSEQLEEEDEKEEREEERQQLKKKKIQNVQHRLKNKATAAATNVFPKFPEISSDAVNMAVSALLSSSEAEPISLNNNNNTSCFENDREKDYFDIDDDGSLSTLSSGDDVSDSDVEQLANKEEAQNIIFIPHAIKQRLEIDHQMVKQRGQMAQIPSNLSIVDILEDYVKYFGLKTILGWWDRVVLSSNQSASASASLSSSTSTSSSSTFSTKRIKIGQTNSSSSSDGEDSWFVPQQKQKQQQDNNHSYTTRKKQGGSSFGESSGVLQHHQYNQNGKRPASPDVHGSTIDDGNVDENPFQSFNQLLGSVDKVKKDIDGLRILFDYLCNYCLLYSEEKVQYKAFREAEVIHESSLLHTRSNKTLQPLILRCKKEFQEDDILPLPVSVHHPTPVTINNLVPISQKPRRMSIASCKYDNEYAKHHPVSSTPIQHAKMRTRRNSIHTIETSCIPSTSSSLLFLPPPTPPQLNRDLTHSDLNKLKNEAKEYVCKLLQWRLLPENKYYSVPAHPTLLYGLVHLMRLIVKMPGIFSKMSMKIDDLQTTLNSLNGVTRFLSKYDKYFDKYVKYVPAEDAVLLPPEIDQNQVDEEEADLLE